MARRLFLPLSVGVLLAAALIVPLPVFVERPRAPLDLTDAVSVEPETAPIEGAYLLIAVSLRRATVADLLIAPFDDDAGFLAVGEVLPPEQTDRGFFAEQRDVFATVSDLAAALGLEAAGYDVLSGDGALVAAVQPGSPADGVLRQGDVIVAVDGEPIATADDLVSAITAEEAGRERRLGVRREDEELEVAVTPEPITRDAPQVGVQIDTADARLDMPFDVDVEGGRIGGPSGGLMVALTVFDLASDTDLADGRRIAGTGAIDPTGTVVPIGSLARKVLASDRAGAELFLVPAVQQQDAEAVLPPRSDMEVVGVASLDEAIEVLGGP